MVLMDIHGKDPSHDFTSITKQAEVVVLMVPFPMQSHLNQLLQLACLISSHNIPILYATTAALLRQAKHRFNNTTYLQNSQIHFHEFPTPDSTSPPPTTDPSIKFPTHFQPLINSSIHIRQPVAALLHSIAATARRVIVVHDVMMAYVVQDVVDFPNAESYGFNPISAFSFFFNDCEMKGKPSVEEPPPKGLPDSDGSLPPEILKFTALQLDFQNIKFFLQ